MFLILLSAIWLHCFQKHRKPLSPSPTLHHSSPLIQTINSPPLRVRFMNAIFAWSYFRPERLRHRWQRITNITKREQVYFACCIFYYKIIINKTSHIILSKAFYQEKVKCRSIIAATAAVERPSLCSLVCLP